MKVSSITFWMVTLSSASRMRLLMDSSDANRNNLASWRAAVKLFLNQGFIGIVPDPHQSGRERGAAPEVHVSSGRHQAAVRRLRRYWTMSFVEVPGRKT